MKKNSASQLLLIAFTMLLFSCRKEDIKGFFDKDHSAKYNTYKGPQVQMGNGHARSWITINHAGVPNEIGMEITASATEGLPHDMAEYVLPLHQKALDVTSFEHLVINWAPHGHPPGGVFTVPHYDLHFYTIPNAARLAIPPYPMAMAAFDNLPPDGYIPAGYMPDPGWNSPDGQTLDGWQCSSRHIYQNDDLWIL